MPTDGLSEMLPLRIRIKKGEEPDHKTKTCKAESLDEFDHIAAHG
jgi:hypothetical protein